jgi:acetolactate decarboxylase
MRTTLLLLVLGSLSACAPRVVVERDAAPPRHAVEWTGTMRETVRQGRTGARVQLDSLTARPHLVAVGPVAGLRGEVTVLDGQPWIASVAEGDVRVSATDDVGAPFLVWAWVPTWSAVAVPDSVVTLAQLEPFVRAAAAGAGVPTDAPFAFRVQGTAASLTLHVLDQPAGAPYDPADHDRIKHAVQRASMPVEVVGFYSERHQSVFTHHDSFVHAHVIAASEGLAGHLDALALAPGATLLLPLSR